VDNLIFVDLDETLLHTMSPPVNIDTRIERYVHRVNTAHAHGDVDGMRLANRLLTLTQAVKDTWETAIPFNEFETDARVALRPGVVEGLNGLYGLGDVMVFTAANRAYAEQALAISGLRPLVQNVFSLRDSPDLSWAFSRPRVLLDDTPAHEKLACLGVDPESFSFVHVEVAPFTAVGRDVPPLTDYVPQAHRKLLLQHAANL
jgi:hypothetical protein